MAVEPSKIFQPECPWLDRIGPDGDKHSAEEIHAMTLSNLNGEFARIVSAADVIASLETMRQ